MVPWVRKLFKLVKVNCPGMYMCANACAIIGDRTSLNYCTSAGTWTIINMSSGYFIASELMLHSSTDLSGSIRFRSMFIPMSLLWSHSTEHSTPFLLILLASFYSHSHSTPVIVLPFYCVFPILWCLVDDHCIRVFCLLQSTSMLLTILLP